MEDLLKVERDLSRPWQGYDMSGSGPAEQFTPMAETGAGAR
jgi:hypothetical protein